MERAKAKRNSKRKVAEEWHETAQKYPTLNDLEEIKRVFEEIEREVGEVHEEYRRGRGGG